MLFPLKKKSRRLRGAELVVTGGITVFLSYIASWLAPAAFCVYGLYRWIFKKSYKDGIISLAVGILLVILLKGPLDFVVTLAMATGGTAAGIGALMMFFPGKKDNEVEIKPTKVDDYEA